MTDSLAPSGVFDPLEERLIVALPRLRAHLKGHGAKLGSADVDDLAQEVMARALRYRDSFDRSRALWPWLRRMADHVLHDHHNARARRPELSEELDPTAPEGQAALDLRDEVESVLGLLSERERSVLLRFHQMGHSVRRIAADLGLPEGTVKSHLSRARRRLAGFGADRDEGSRAAGISKGTP